MPPITQDEINAFVARCQKIVDDYFAVHYKNLVSDLLECDPTAAKKYARVTRRHRTKNDDGSIVTTERLGSVHCFIGLEDGNVYKPDGWKRPARLRKMEGRTPATEFVWADALLSDVADGYTDLRFNLNEFLPAGSFPRRWLDQKIETYRRRDANQEEWASACEATGPAPAWE